jgi:phage major head subunit gpT-like protein
MAIGYTPASANVEASFASLLKSFPEVRNVFFDEFKMYPSLYNQFLDVETSKKKYEIENTVGGRPKWSSKSEAAEYTFGDYAQGTEVTYTHTTYADAFDVSEEMDEDNEHKKVMNSAREMARGGYAAVEDSAADVLNNGFSGGTTGADGSQLFASDHDLINSVSTGDNALTTALGVDGLKDAYELADKIVNEAGIYVPVEYKTLIVPPELRQTAEELVNSTLTPFTSNNATNVYKNRITKIVVNPYLSSTTAWFLVSESLKKKGKFFWRVKPQFKPGVDQYSGNFLYKARERFSAGHTDWQGAIGSTGVA